MQCFTKKERKKEIKNRKGLNIRKNVRKRRMKNNERENSIKKKNNKNKK